LREAVVVSLFAAGGVLGVTWTVTVAALEVAVPSLAL
jgi:hypothetical protein